MAMHLDMGRSCCFCAVAWLVSRALLMSCATAAGLQYRPFVMPVSDSQLCHLSEFCSPLQFGGNAQIQVDEATTSIWLPASCACLPVQRVPLVGTRQMRQTSPVNLHAFAESHQSGAVYTRMIASWPWVGPDANVVYQVT